MIFWVALADRAGEPLCGAWVVVAVGISCGDLRGVIPQGQLFDQCILRGCVLRTAHFPETGSGRSVD